MWFLIVLLFVAVAVLAVFARLLRKRKTAAAEKPVPDREIPADCCGQHAVCERDSLLNNGAEIVYYDDEELDALAGVSPIDFTPEQLQQLEYVFYTLHEKDVAGWLRSLQARNIQLPSDLRDEALLIVSERRSQ